MAKERDTVEALSAWISRLVTERQALREAAADAAALERNRVEIARLQQRLSRAFIRKYA